MNALWIRARFVADLSNPMSFRPVQVRLDRTSVVLAILFALLSRGDRLLADSVSSGSVGSEAHAKLCKCAACHGDLSLAHGPRDLR